MEMASPCGTPETALYQVGRRTNSSVGAVALWRATAVGGPGKWPACVPLLCWETAADLALEGAGEPEVQPLHPS